MKVPLDAYLRGEGAKVYSLVVEVPYTPLDIDLGYLARGEWDIDTDRFRVWHLSGEEGDGPPVCYVMVRKFDPKYGVVVYGHVVVNIGANARKGDPSFIVGILSNDEVRARVTLNSMLDIPPSFHRRSDLLVIEKRWRSDPEVVMRFLANVHSAMSRSTLNLGSKALTLMFDPPSGIMKEFKRDLGSWWG